MDLRKKTYPLDNAAFIFPSIIDDRTTVTFRISFTLRAEIDRALLQRALDGTLERFPYFRVRLERNYFRYYLAEFDGNARLDESDADPCRAFTAERDGGFLFRVRPFGRTIALEMSHVLTDGTGALLFLKTLTANYLALQGRVSGKGGESLGYSVSIPEDTECPYRRHYREDSPSHPIFSGAYRIPGPLMAPESYRVDRRSIPAAGVLEGAKKLGVSVTEYLAAAYLAALQRLYREIDGGKKNSSTIRVEVPVNLRAFFPAESLRNFTLFVMPEIDPEGEELAFGEIAARTHRQIRLQTRPERLLTMMSRNVRGEKHPLIRWMPRVLRDPILRVAYSKLGENQFSGLLSNLGKIELPPVIAAYVEEVDFVAAPSAVLKAQCGVVTWNDRIFVNFGSLLENGDLEQTFFAVLSELGHESEPLPRLW